MVVTGWFVLVVVAGVVPVVVTSSPWALVVWLVRAGDWGAVPAMLGLCATLLLGGAGLAGLLGIRLREGRRRGEQRQCGDGRKNERFGRHRIPPMSV